VLEAFERRADTIIRLAFRDERGRSVTLRVTPEHPFWRPSVGWTRVGWTRAGDLLAGQELLGLGTGRLTVVSVAVVNLKVDEDLTSSARGGRTCYTHLKYGGPTTARQQCREESPNRVGPF